MEEVRESKAPADALWTLKKQTTISWKGSQQLLRASVSQPEGTEFCQQQVSLEEDPEPQMR